ncbi:MAG: hypothetical protein EHM28_08100 [Spirochaetaceae bacterium]|nr:MAG: hypothetical protein EHM28_08100 [Spirochaetaceae bacterium]
MIIMKKTRHHSFLGFVSLRMIFSAAVALFLAAGCGDSGPKGLGLQETPAMLYKSFRASTPGAHEGKAPELAADVDLSPMLPAPGNQGMIGSCTAWTTAYACKSYQENAERGWGVADNKHIFSPSYIYNQINNGSDSGAALEDAVMVVIKSGCATLDSMPYTQDLRVQPSLAAKTEAANYKAVSFARVDATNPAAVKEKLNSGHPVLIGMMVYENFQTYTGGVYSSIKGNLIGGHAMCVVGYDEGKHAFKIINSWSTAWGEGGYAWIHYDIFVKYVPVCLVLYDEVTYSPVVPSVPVNVEASLGTYADKIEVTWERAENAESYEVFRSLSETENFTKIAVTKGTRYIDSKGLKTGTHYYYAIKGINGEKESSLSETASGFAGKIQNIIGIPLDVEGLFDFGIIYLSWKKTPDINGYNVYAFDPEKETYVMIGSTRNPAYKDDREHAPGTTAWYVITAFTANDESQPSRALSVDIPAPQKPEEPVMIDAPRDLTASQGDHEDRIALKWKSSEGADEYTVFCWNEKTETWDSVGETTDTEFEDKQPARTLAYYAVAGKNDRISGERSQSVSGFTKGYTKEEPAVYDDKDYYDDRELEDKDYKDEDLYVDDREQPEPKPVTDAFFDTKEEQEEFFDSKEEQEEFFDSKEDEEKFFGTKKEEEDFFGGTEGFFD